MQRPRIFAQAVKYAKQCLSVLPKAQKPAGMRTRQTGRIRWINAYAIAYGVIGQDAYSKNQFGLAIKNLEERGKVL